MWNYVYTLMTEDEFCSVELENFYRCSDTTEQSHKVKENCRTKVLMKRNEYIKLKNSFYTVANQVCFRNSI